MKKIVSLLLLLVLVLSLSACQSGGSEPTPSDDGISADVLADIKQSIEDGVTEDISPMVSSVTVVESNDAVSISIRTVAVGGSYLAPVAAVLVPVALEKVEALELELGDITVSEYSKGNSGGITDMIAWRSKDGEVGTFSDDSGKEPVIKTKVSLDDLAAMFE